MLQGHYQGTERDTALRFGVHFEAGFEMMEARIKKKS
jgi:hypothetical protein